MHEGGTKVRSCPIGVVSLYTGRRMCTYLHIMNQDQRFANQVLHMYRLSVGSASSIPYMVMQNASDAVERSNKWFTPIDALWFDVQPKADFAIELIDATYRNAYRNAKDTRDNSKYDMLLQKLNDAVLNNLLLCVVMSALRFVVNKN